MPFLEEERIPNNNYYSVYFTSYTYTWQPRLFKQCAERLDAMIVNIPNIYLSVKSLNSNLKYLCYFKVVGTLLSY